MTRTEAFEKAWRLGADKKDFSLVDEIYHPDYKAVDVMTGVEVNLEDDKTRLLLLAKKLQFDPTKLFLKPKIFCKCRRVSE